MENSAHLLTEAQALTAQDHAEVWDITRRIPGYSDAKHYAFFKSLFGRTGIRSILVLGVYHGRDIAFMQSVLAGRTIALDGDAVWIVGVDKFTDTACADWPQERAAMGWDEAGFGLAPDFAAARANTASDHVSLIRSDDEAFLATTAMRFDCVYLDTSHDYATVKRQLGHMQRICAPGALICGDDYSDAGRWGVKSAVADSFNRSYLFADWIWFANLEDLK